MHYEQIQSFLAKSRRRTTGLESQFSGQRIGILKEGRRIVAQGSLDELR